MVERHRDVGAQAPLDLGGALGREQAATPVDVTLELDALVIHAAEPVEREDLKPARVGEQRAVPRHESVQPAELCDHVLAGANVQVVGVGEHDARAHGFEVGGGECAHAALRADGHEGRRLDRPVRQCEHAGPRAAGRGVDREIEHQASAETRGSSRA